MQGAEIGLKALQEQHKEGQVTGELGLEGESAGEGRGGAGVGLDLWAASGTPCCGLPFCSQPLPSAKHIKERTGETTRTHLSVARARRHADQSC